jgi:hypothetical protein
MTFTDFMAKYNGKYIDFDGVYGAQCMDLMHQYCVEVLGITDGSILAAPAAKDIYNNFDNLNGHDLFEKIGNTPTGIPNEGDIVVWGMGDWGHVAIFIDGNADRFNSFDQNFPIGSPCHVQNHPNYTDVLGWLHFKGVGDTIPVLKTDFENLVTKATKLDQQQPTYEALKQQITEMLSQLDGANQTIKSEQDWDAKIAQMLGVANIPSTIEGEITKLIGTEDSLRIMTNNFQESQRAVEDRNTTITNLGQQIVDLQVKIQNTTDQSAYYAQMEVNLQKCNMDLSILKQQKSQLSGATRSQLLKAFIATFRK